MRCGCPWYPHLMATHKQTVRRLLDVAGTTFAEQAGIKLTNTPAQLSWCG